MTTTKENEIFMEDDNFNENGFSLIADFQEGGEHSPRYAIIDKELPILPLRNMILFPATVLPVSVGRESSLQLINELEKNRGFMGVFCQKNPATEEPKFNDLHETGTVAKIIKVFNMPDDSTTVILQGYQRITLNGITDTSPYLKGTVEDAPEVDHPMDKEYEGLINSCKEAAKRLFKRNDTHGEVSFAISNIDNIPTLVNFLCANIKIHHDEKLILLKESSIKERAFRLMTILDRELQFADLNDKIRSKTHRDLDQQQREYYLQQQIKNIQEELGGNVQDQDAKELRDKADMKLWSREIDETFNRELAKLNRINPQSPDYHVQLNYLQMFVSLPWGECTSDNLDMANARKVLDRDHYGLDKVKERILEHLAVIKMRGDLKSPIICLYGPPGVGKTSLGKSIASALKRKYVRMSLGGIHDESEIRGHRKTYIGAMTGRILKNLSKAGTDNPVFILDEIDKVGQASMHGDPSSALLEVLDPEQNSSFHDNFLDVDYDLS